MLLLSLWLGLVALGSLASSSPLETVYEWKYIDYKFNNAKQRAMAIKKGKYDYTKSVIVDVDRARDGRTFVSVIRTKGVPSSLNIVSKVNGKGGPLLKPYPNWRWAANVNCTGITNVYRMAIDHCDRLWVLDTGRIGNKRVCPAKLLAFDLHKNKVIRNVKIPNSISQGSKRKMGLLVTPVVETYGSRCAKTFVYMADTRGYGLLIFDGSKIWRLESKVYQPDPKQTTFTIAGQDFRLRDGVLGLALSPDTGEKDRTLYFKPLASRDMYLAATNDLKRTKYGRRAKYYKISKFLPSQSTTQAFSTQGTLFFGLTAQSAIGCWSRYRPGERQNVGIAVRDRKRLQFVSGVKVIPNYVTGYDEELWVVSNRFQKVLKKNQNFNEVNFRIMKASVHDLIGGTICEPPYRGDPDQHVHDYLSSRSHR